MLIVLNCIALCIFSIGSYLIWWDRKNVFNLFFIGFCIIGYIMPTCILDFEFFADSEIVNLYFIINIIGCVFFIAGLFVGFKWRSVALVDAVMKFGLIKRSVGDPRFDKSLLSVSVKIYCVCLVVMILCFLAMGYAPMFAADPFMAKQFKGEYQPSYQRVALFYRTAKQFIGLLMPFIIIDAFYNRKIWSIILTLVGLFLIFITMSRSETVTGLVTVISILVVMKRGRVFFFFYIVFLVLVFSFGSGFWAVLSYLFPDSGFSKLSLENVSILESIAAGAPDIPDQLTMLNAFVSNHVSNTFGLTFIGGLIPYNFKWNPAVWTLTVLNQTDDISEIASGGLRLPIPLWGYVSFGWAGVCMLPFISAFFTGYIMKKVKQIVEMLKPNFNGLMIFYLLIFVYINIGVVFIEFFRLSIYSAPAFAFYALVIYAQRARTKSLQITTTT